MSDEYTTALIAEARERALMYTGGPEADRLWRLAAALEASTSDHTDSEKALIDRVNELIDERDSLSALHEVATERTVQLAAVIEKAEALTERHWTHEGAGEDLRDAFAEVLASAPDAVLREHDAKVLEDARVRPEFTEYLPNDGEYEYTSASDCDGSNVKYWRRRPRHIGDYFPWEPTTEELHAAALRVGANPTDETGVGA